MTTRMGAFEWTSYSEPLTEVDSIFAFTQFHTEEAILQTMESIVNLAQSVPYFRDLLQVHKEILVNAGVQAQQFPLNSDLQDILQIEPAALSIETIDLSNLSDLPTYQSNVETLETFDLINKLKELDPQTVFQEIPIIMQETTSAFFNGVIPNLTLENILAYVYKIVESLALTPVV